MILTLCSDTLIHAKLTPDGKYGSNRYHMLSLCPLTTLHESKFGKNCYMHSICIVNTLPKTQDTPEDSWTQGTIMSYTCIAPALSIVLPRSQSVRDGVLIFGKLGNNCDMFSI